MVADRAAEAAASRALAARVELINKTNRAAAARAELARKERAAMAAVLASVERARAAERAATVKRAREVARVAEIDRLDHTLSSLSPASIIAALYERLTENDEGMRAVAQIFPASEFPMGKGREGESAEAAAVTPAARRAATY